MLCDHAYCAVRPGTQKSLVVCLLRCMPDETQRMLWHYCWIIQTYDNLQFIFQIFSFVQQTATGIPWNWSSVCPCSVLHTSPYHFQSITGPPATPTLDTSGYVVIRLVVMKPPKAPTVHAHSCATVYIGQ